MALERITTHVADAKARLLSQYKDTTYLSGLVGILCAESQVLEDAFWALYSGRQLANAQGAQLDGIAALVGASRNNANDNILRALIAGAIAQHTSDGTASSLLNAVAAMYQARAVFRKDATSPGATLGQSQAVVSFAVGSPQTDPSFYPQTVQILTGALPAGLALASVSTFDANGTFAFAGPQSWVGGFGDATNPAAGAPLASLSYSNPLT